MRRVSKFGAGLLGCAVVLCSQTGTPGNVSSERAVFFSGQVAMEDGSAPPETVPIQQVCGSQTREVARTDSKGRFSFKADGRQGNSGDDASAPPAQPSDFGKPIGSSTVYTNPVTSSLRGCEVQAVLAGFRSERASISIKNTLDNSRLGTIILHPISHGSALTISATSLNVPPKAKKAYEKGLAASKAQKWAEANSAFEKAVHEYPEYAAAWYEWGVAHQAQQDYASAAEAWKRALTLDPKFVKPYESLTALAYRREDWINLDEYCAQWLKLDPNDFPAAYLFEAFAAAKLGRGDDAVRLGQEGLRIDKEHSAPKLNYVLGVVLLGKQNWGEAARYFQAYLQEAPNAPEAAGIREQLPKLQAAAAAQAAVRTN